MKACKRVVPSRRRLTAETSTQCKGSEVFWDRPDVVLFFINIPFFLSPSLISRICHLRNCSDFALFACLYPDGAVRTDAADDAYHCFQLSGPVCIRDGRLTHACLCVCSAHVRMSVCLHMLACALVSPRMCASGVHACVHVSVHACMHMCVLTCRPSRVAMR